MKKSMLLFAIGYCFAGNVLICEIQAPKIIALVPGHNDSRFMPNCFRALSKYVDAIIYLDDASTDDSVAVAQSLAEECKIEQIVVKDEWIRNAAADRNKLLKLGRKAGGTHFVVLDLDEMFTANCMDNNKLRNHILGLQPGEQLVLTWIQLWRSVDQYRYDDSGWTNHYMRFAFCDDGVCAYAPRFLGESRTPDTLRGMQWFLEGYEYGVLHFQFVNFDNLLRKQAWYRCMERVYNKHRSIESINDEYRPSKDERGLRTVPAPIEWFAGYDFFDPSICYHKEEWREQDVMRWCTTYGMERFAGLDIWDTQWPFEQYIGENGSFLDTFVFLHKEEGTFLEIGTPHIESRNPLLFLNTYRQWSGYSIQNEKAHQYTTRVKQLDLDDINTVSTAERVAVIATATNTVLHTYDAAVTAKLKKEISRFQDRYSIQQLTVGLTDESMNVDLCVIHESTVATEELLWAFDFEKYPVKVIALAEHLVENNLKEVVEKIGFTAIKYNDHGYYYFFKYTE